MDKWIWASSESTVSRWLWRSLNCTFPMNCSSSTLPLHLCQKSGYFLLHPNSAASLFRWSFLLLLFCVVILYQCQFSLFLALIEKESRSKIKEIEWIGEQIFATESEIKTDGWKSCAKRQNFLGHHPHCDCTFSCLSIRENCLKAYYYSSDSLPFFEKWKGTLMKKFFIYMQFLTLTCTLVFSKCILPFDSMHFAASLPWSFWKKEERFSYIQIPITKFKIRIMILIF